MAGSGQSPNDPGVTTLQGNSQSTTASSSSTTPPTENPHITFGSSVKHWSVFLDSSKALHDLSKHFKLVVLSNVDRASFAYTHGYLSENIQPSDSPVALPLYSRPSPNSQDLWLPDKIPGSKSPFSLILTAQDTQAYKPSLQGFNIALEALRTEPSLLGSDNLTTEDIKSKVLVVAQSLTHDHEAASQLGIRSVWIDRQGANMRPDGGETHGKWTWKFETLGEMAKAVKDEIEGGTD